MRRKLDVALLGASGYWAKRILPNLLELSSIRLRALVSHSAPPSALRPMSPRDDVLLTRDLDRVLDDPAIGAVVIATPTGTHFPLTLEAVRRGKHVFLEKPPALSSKEVRRLRAEARRKETVVVVDHLYLFSKHLMKMDRLIQSGRIGAPLHFYSQRANFGLFRRDSDTLSDLGYHDIYILRRLFRDYRPLRISCSTSHHFMPGHADTGVFSVQFDRGLKADVYLSWLSPSKDRRIVVAGTEGILEFRGDRELLFHRKRVVFRNGRFHPTDRGSRVLPVMDRSNPLREALRHFAQCALERRESPLCSLSEGLETVRWQERIRRSARERKAVVL